MPADDVKFRSTTSSANLDQNCREDSILQGTTQSANQYLDRTVIYKRGHMVEKIGSQGYNNYFVIEISITHEDTLLIAAFDI